MTSRVVGRASRNALCVAGNAILAFAAVVSWAAAPTPSSKPDAGAKPPSTSAVAPAAGAPAAATSAPQAQSLDPSLQTDVKVKLTSLDQWDAQVDALTQLAWQVHGGGQSGTDLGGHDLDYYWQRHVFTPKTKESLEQLRDKAQKQSVSKDTAGLQRTLDEASAILTAERGKAFAVTLLLSAQSPVSYHLAQLGPWLARATDQDRDGIQQRVAATYDRLQQELEQVVTLREPESPRATAARYFQLLVEPSAFFNAERARLIKAQADQPNPVRVEPRTRGNKPCPAPVQPTKGRDKPALAPDFPSSEDFYPRTVKFNNVEGVVTLRVSISATGCIERAEIAGTSGVAELDEGALNLAMAGSYVPAAAGDKPAPGTMMFRVKFEQSDASAPAR